MKPVVVRRVTGDEAGLPIRVLWASPFRARVTQRSAALLSDISVMPCTACRGVGKATLIMHGFPGAPFLSLLDKRFVTRSSQPPWILISPASYSILKPGCRARLPIPTPPELA